MTRPPTNLPRHFAGVRGLLLIAIFSSAGCFGSTGICTDCGDAGRDAVVQLDSMTALDSSCIPSCPDGRMLFEGACPPDVACTELSACGATVFCQVPDCDVEQECAEATSTLLFGGGGYCPPPTSVDAFDGCFEEEHCGVVSFCMTRCATGDHIVANPAECDGAACYHVREEDGGTVWCSGEGDSQCEALPACLRDETMLPLTEVCPPEWQCDFVTACTTTIQCGRDLTPPG